MPWQQYGKIFQDAGDVGGDEQVGESTSVRFVNPDLPGRLVTIYAYPVGVSHLGEDGDNVKATGIRSQTEFMICRDIDDPGGTEVWADYIYVDEAARSFASVKDGERTAAAWIRLATPEGIKWDGEAF